MWRGRLLFFCPVKQHKAAAAPTVCLLLGFSKNAAALVTKTLTSVSAETKETFPSEEQHTDERLQAAEHFLFVCDLGWREERFREEERGWRDGERVMRGREERRGRDEEDMDGGEGERQKRWRRGGWRREGWTEKGSMEFFMLASLQPPLIWALTLTDVSCWNRRSRSGHCCFPIRKINVKTKWRARDVFPVLILPPCLLMIRPGPCCCSLYEFKIKIIEQRLRCINV